MRLVQHFSRSSDPVVEELSFMVFQKSYAVQVTSSSSENFVSFHEFFQFRKKKQKSLGARTTHLITGQLKHWLLCKMPALNYSVTSVNYSAIRARIARQMAGWKTKNNSSTMVSEHWRNAEPSAFQLQVTMLKSDKI